MAWQLDLLQWLIYLRQPELLQGWACLHERPRMSTEAGMVCAPKPPRSAELAICA